MTTYPLDKAIRDQEKLKLQERIIEQLEILWAECEKDYEVMRDKAEAYEEAIKVVEQSLRYCFEYLKDRLDQY